MKNWNNNYEIGREHIDDHHEEVFQLTNMLDQAIEDNSRTKINDIILYLEHYVVDHFKEEETLMKNHNFAEYQEHYNEHCVFIELVKNLRSLYNEGIHTTHVILKIRQLIDKLMHHIITIDSKMARLT